MNPSAQVGPCPWMCLGNQIHGLVGRCPFISVVESYHCLNPSIIGGRANLLAKCRPILSFFGPPNYPLSHGTISFSAKVSPLTTSSPYFFQSALRISSTPLLIFFPNNLLEIALTSVMVGGRLRDLISSARRRTSSSVGFRHYSQGARAILLLFSVNPRHEQTIAQNTFAHSPIVAVSTVAIPITPINRHPNATPAA